MPLGGEQGDVDALAGELAQGEDGLHAGDAAAGDEHAQRRGVRVRGHAVALSRRRPPAPSGAATRPRPWKPAIASAGVDPGSLDAARLRRLIDAGRSLVSQLDLDELLERLIEIAASITGRALRRARHPRRRAARARALPHARHRRGGAARDRRPPARARHPRRADRGPAAAAAGQRRRRRPLLRLPARPPADGDVPRHAGDDPRRGLGQPLPDREGGRRGVHRRRRGGGRDPRRVGRDRDRERAPLPGLRAPPRRARGVRAAAGGDDRDRARDRRRDRPRPRARADRQARARARGRARDGDPARRGARARGGRDGRRDLAGVPRHAAPRRRRRGGPRARSPATGSTRRCSCR